MRSSVENRKFSKPDKSLLSPSAVQYGTRAHSCTLYNRLVSPEHAHLNEDFSTEEICAAQDTLKQCKAPGPDGVHNEFLAHLIGLLGREWLRSFMKVCYSLRWILKMWCRATVVGILKPGKPASEAASYRHISQLCSSFKLLQYGKRYWYYSTESTQSSTPCCLQNNPGSDKDGQ